MPNPSAPQAVTSLNVRNILRCPEAYIEKLFVGKNRRETIDEYVEQRLHNLTNLEAAIEAKIQSMQQVLAQQLHSMQQQGGGNQVPGGLQQTLQALEQRIQALEYRPTQLQGPEGKQGIPGPQGPAGKPGPRGLRGQAGGAKKLSELSDIQLPSKIKDGAILTYKEDKDAWVPMYYDEEEE